MLLLHLTVSACARALLRLGSRIEISRAMMPMTTSNSTSVNAAREARARLAKRIGIGPPDVATSEAGARSALMRLEVINGHEPIRLRRRLTIYQVTENAPNRKHGPDKRKGASVLDVRSLAIVVSETRYFTAMGVNNS